MSTRARTPALIRTLLPFGRGNITKLALAYFFSTLYFYIPVGTLYLRSKNLSYVQINSLWGIIVFTMFLAEVPTGMLADRIGYKRAVNAALALQLVGEVIYVFARGYPGFVLASVAGGLGFAFASGCVDALAYDTLESAGRESMMTEAMGYVEAAQRLANLIAFSIGGLLIRTLTEERFVLAIILTACSVGIGLLVSLTLKEPASPAREEARTRGPWRLLTEGLKLLRGNRVFRTLVVLALITIPFRDYLGSLYQPRFVDVGVPSVWLGLALSIASGLSIAGARCAHVLERRLGRGRGLLVASGLPGLLYLALAAVSSPALTVLAFCALYGSTSLRGPILSGQLNLHIDSANRATVLSLVSMLSGIYVALMGPLIGRIADASVRWAIASVGILVLAGAGLSGLGGAIVVRSPDEHQPV